MSRQWLLVEWVDERNVFPSYGVVNVNALVNDDNDLHPGKMTFVRAKHGNSARGAQILRLSDDKRHIKEHKLLLERQDHQVKNMLSVCMRTIKEMKTDPLLYGPFNTSQNVSVPGSSGSVPADSSDSSSSFDSSQEQLTKDTKNQQKNASVKALAQLKRTITDYYNNERAESSSELKRKSVLSSTPLPTRSDTNESPKLMFDQATQTDDEMAAQISYEKIEEFETVLTKLYKKFVTLVGRLQLDCEDYTLSNSDAEQNKTIESDKEQTNEQTVEETHEGQNLNNSNVEAKDPQNSANAKSLQVRRVSAHTTNTVEQSFVTNNDMVAIGAGHATVPARLMNEINWDSYSSATRQLLQAIFPRKVLATHSLTGKKSPAFANKPAKKCLDPKLIEDIVDTVSQRCGVPKRSVRSCITIKCTDEAKLYRNRMQGRANQISAVHENQENVSPSPNISHASSNGSG